MFSTLITSFAGKETKYNQFFILQIHTILDEFFLFSDFFDSNNSLTKVFD